LDTRQENVGEYFTRNEKQRYWSVAAAAFSLVRGDDDAIFPVSLYGTSSPDRQQDGMKCSSYWWDSKFQKFCKDVI